VNGRHGYRGLTPRRLVATSGCRLLRWARGHNDLAWLCARCRRHLDQGLTHAQTAVALAPTSAPYLDTLAEVHFPRGDQAKAIELMQRCLELVPGRDFYRGQLKRFQAGDRFAEIAPSPQ
jgi:hypothetical protein